MPFFQRTTNAVAVHTEAKPNLHRSSLAMQALTPSSLSLGERQHTPSLAMQALPSNSSLLLGRRQHQSSLAMQASAPSSLSLDKRQRNTQPSLAMQASTPSSLSIDERQRNTQSSLARQASTSNSIIATDPQYDNWNGFETSTRAKPAKIPASARRNAFNCAIVEIKIFWNWIVFHRGGLSRQFQKYYWGMGLFQSGMAVVVFLIETAGNQSWPFDVIVQHCTMILQWECIVYFILCTTMQCMMQHTVQHTIQHEQQQWV